MNRKILITSALPYANGPLHFGHIAGAYLPADVYARFERLRGSDVLYICGSDEYGVAIALSAELANRSPKEHVDLFHQVNLDLFKKLEISFDHFSRTTSKEHAPLVIEFFTELLNNGYIEARETEQLYSEAQNRFLADRYVVGTCPSCGYNEARGDECGRCGASYEATELQNPRSKLTDSPLILKKTTHYFLLFDKLKTKILALLQSRDWKPNVMNFATPYASAVHPRAITRDLSWGVPVPDMPGKVFYVWFDAPIGYISATKEWALTQSEPAAWEKYWLDPQTKYVQFMGKDNIPFHAIFFPAMIMGQNQPYKMVDELVANEFYNYEGKKFSKSDNWYIDFDDFFAHYEADQIRYCIAANAPETADSEFTWKDFQMRCNTELLGKLGNFVNRVLVFVQNQCQGKIPKRGTLTEADLRFESDMHRLTLEIEEHYADFRLRKVAATLMEFAALGNSYFDKCAPWKEAKQEATRPIMETAISLCLECIKRLALIASPLIPQTAEKIWQMLAKKDLNKEHWHTALQESLLVDEPLPKPTVLFKKIEDATIEQEYSRLKS